MMAKEKSIDELFGDLGAEPSEIKRALELYMQHKKDGNTLDSEVGTVGVNKLHSDAEVVGMLEALRMFGSDAEIAQGRSIKELMYNATMSLLMCAVVMYVLKWTNKTPLQFAD